MIRKNSGITLISLIIIIIILIILAGISISMILGNEGILNKAKYATDSYSNAQQQEEIDIAKLTNQINGNIDGSRDTVTISKDEYDKLKNVNNYSTEETVIGTWIDGKPIYRNIVLQDSLTKGKLMSIDVSNLNIDTFIDVKLCCKYNSKSFTFFGGPLNTSSYSVGIHTNPTNIMYVTNGSWAYDFTDCKFIIKYTKTTDNVS